VCIARMAEEFDGIGGLYDTGGGHRHDEITYMATWRTRRWGRFSEFLHEKTLLLRWLYYTI